MFYIPTVGVPIVGWIRMTIPHIYIHQVLTMAQMFTLATGPTGTNLPCAHLYYRNGSAWSRLCTTQQTVEYVSALGTPMTATIRMQEAKYMLTLRALYCCVTLATDGVECLFAI